MGRAAATQDAQAQPGPKSSIDGSKNPHQEIENSFRLMADNTPVMLWVTDAKGQCIYLNKQWYDFTGQSPRSALGMGWLKAVHPDDAKRSQEVFLNANKHHEPFSLEYRLKTSRGDYHWAIDSGLPKFDSSGSFEGFNGSVVDIQERKLAEEEITNSEQRYRYIFESAEVSIWEEDFSAVIQEIQKLKDKGVKNFRKYLRDHPAFVKKAISLVKVRDVNRASVKMFGAKNKDQLLRSFDQIFLPETLSVFAEEMIALAHGKPAFSAETAVRSLTGQRANVLLTLHFPSDSLQTVLVTIMDITDRKLSEQNVQYLATLTQNIPDAVISTDTIYNITSWNKGAENIYGWKSEEVCDKPAGPLLKTEFPNGEAGRRSWQEALKTKGNWRGEVTQQRKDGSRVNVFASIANILDTDGNVIGGVAVNRDITHEKLSQKRQQELLAVTEQRNALLKLNKIKDEFIALASHQLRTPATAVKQYLSMLIDEYAGRLSDEQQKFLNIAYESNERELKIINELLKTAQIDAQNYKLNKSLLDIVALVKSAISEMQPAFDLSRHKIKLTTPDKKIEISADKAEIKLALINLLDNASKYSHADTPIVISVSKKPGVVEISIKDIGVGISAGDQKRIFEKFTRVNNELSETINGTGLGLYWVRKIVAMHNGQVLLNSKPGKGSEFILRLPINNDKN